MSGYTALQWQSPQWLWLLLALAVPLLIHLVRRSKPRVITFAAAQWLQAKQQRRLNKLFLRDPWLLLLRLLIVALIALLLAQPLLKRSAVPVENILLVDPRIERSALQAFLTEHPDLSRPMWLQRRPTATTEARPEVTDLWSTLTVLADQGEFRRAHILLQDGNNPSGHSALRVSPHWQWHALDTEIATKKITLPRLAVIGDAPDWLQPVIEQLSASLEVDLPLQQLVPGALPDAEKTDWLIYDIPGVLPDSVRKFVEQGGLLITDRRVQEDTSKGSAEFASLDSQPPLEATALGRGSWVRYTDDWHSAAFFHRTDLPQQLWQQWRTQDWPLQHRTRGHWSIANNPGIAVADADVKREATVITDQILLIVLALLLLLERSIALLRNPPARTQPGDTGGRVDVH